MLAGSVAYLFIVEHTAVPRLSHRPVFDRLQYAKMEREKPGNELLAVSYNYIVQLSGVNYANTSTKILLLS